MSSLFFKPCCTKERPSFACKVLEPTMKQCCFKSVSYSRAGSSCSRGGPPCGIWENVRTFHSSELPMITPENAFWVHSGVRTPRAPAAPGGLSQPQGVVAVRDPVGPAPTARRPARPSPLCGRRPFLPAHGHSTCHTEPPWLACFSPELSIFSMTPEVSPRFITVTRTRR